LNLTLAARERQEETARVPADSWPAQLWHAFGMTRRATSRPRSTLGALKSIEPTAAVIPAQPVLPLLPVGPSVLLA
jgi:hypothetical protein